VREAVLCREKACAGLRTAPHEKCPVCDPSPLSRLLRTRRLRWNRGSTRLVGSGTTSPSSGSTSRRVRAGGVPSASLGRARLLRRAVAQSSFGCDDDHRPPCSACVGCAEGSDRDADADRRARGACRASSRSGGLCFECAVAPAGRRLPRRTTRLGGHAGAKRSRGPGRSTRGRAVLIRRAAIRGVLY